MALGGGCQREPQHEAGTHFLAFLEKHGFVALNTFVHAGPTFYHVNGGKPARIDYLCAPRSMVIASRV
eukprot:8833905-Lingulodinium_polyedra.AAC.1